MSLNRAELLTHGRPQALVLEYLRLLYRRRWLAAAVLVLVTLAGAAYTYSLTPLYQAQVSLLIDLEEPKVVAFPQVLDESRMFGAYMQTQQELIVSRALVERTVKAMALWKRPEFGITREDDAISAVRSNLQVVPIRGTRMVQVRLRWPDPALAAEIVNEHAKHFVEETLERRFRASREAADWLETQLAAERERVQRSDAALQAFREQHDALALDDDQNIVVQKLTDLNAGVTRAKTARIEKEAQYREIMEAQRDRARLDAFPAILSNAFIEQLKGQLAALQREYAQLAETFGERHPTMIEKRTALETTDARLATELARVVVSVRAGYEAALAEERSLVAALEEQKDEALALDRRGIQYAALSREAESVRLVYQALLQRAKEIGVSQQLRATNVQIIDAARRPTRPVYPRTGFNLAMSGMAALFLALGAVFFREMLNDRIESPEDIIGQLPYPFLGLVPRMRSRRPAESSLARREAPVALIEAFRTLRTSLIAAVDRTDGPRTILIASGSQHEGKTHVACNLAIALAQAGHRVLLIDADLRRPRIHAQLDHRQEPGLSNLLAGTATMNEALQRAAVPGLTVLTAGLPSEQAPELLGSPAFAALLQLLQEHYTWVVIDSPPTLTVTDASIVAPRVAGVVFVVASDMTHRHASDLALARLESAGGRVVGIVLNRADVAQHPFYFAPYANGEYLDALEPTRAPATSSTLLGG